MSKVFSPSQMSAWTQCGTLRSLRNEGWVPRRADARNFAAWVGSGVAEGLAVWNTQRAKGEEGNPCKVTAPIDEMVEVASQEVQDQMTRFLEAGGMLVEEDYLTSVKNIRPFLELATDHDPLGAWTIDCAECELGEAYGNARCDLFGKDEDGVWSVLDYKCTTNLQARWVQSRLDSELYGNQSEFYTWGMRNVREVDVARFYILLLILRPQPRVVLEYREIDLELQGQWLKSAQDQWTMMSLEDEGFRTPSRNGDHATKFGPCTFREACLYQKQGRILMQTDYIQVPRKEKKHVNQKV